MTLTDRFPTYNLPEYIRIVSFEGIVKVKRTLKALLKGFKVVRYKKLDRYVHKAHESESATDMPVHCA